MSKLFKNDNTKTKTNVKKSNKEDNTMRQKVFDKKRKSEILAEYFVSIGYEDKIVKHKDISDVIGESYGTNKYRTIIAQTKTVLQRQYNRHIESVRSEGYRVIKPDDTVKASLSHYKRGFKEMQKGQDILTHAPIQDMSQEGREVFNRTYDRAVRLNAAMLGGVTELNALGDSNNHPLAIGLK